MNEKVADPEDVKAGDVVQINPFADLDQCFQGVYFIVQEVLPWGVRLVNYSPQIGKRNESPGSFSLRVPTNEEGPPKFFRVGQSPIIPGEIARHIWPDAKVRANFLQDGEVRGNLLQTGEE